MSGRWGIEVGTGSLVLLRVPIEAHHRGGEAKRPWVAEIKGPSAKYGLERDFLRPHNDWSEAHAAWSGNVYGRTAQFELRDGRMYEIGRYRGSGNRMHFVREHLRIVERKRVAVDVLAVLAVVDGIADLERQITLTLPDAPETGCSRIVGVGASRPCAFVLRDGERLWRLAEGGLYEITRPDGKYLAEVVDGQRVRRSQPEALEWLARHV